MAAQSRVSIVALLLPALPSLLLPFLAPAVQADDCVHYEDFLHWLSTADTPGEAQDVALDYPTSNSAMATTATP